jgi:CRP-like cAMP-binding protein
MYDLDEEAAAVKNLSSLVLAFAEDRQPILALALVKELEGLGVEVDKVLSRFSEMYAAESPRVEEAELAPPPLPDRDPCEAWDPSGDRAALIGSAKQAMAVAWGDALTRVDEEKKLPFVPILSSLGKDEFVELVVAFSSQAHAPGDVIIEQGTAGDAFYLLVEGQVVVTRHRGAGESRELARLGPGAFVGEMSIVSRAPRAAEVRALLPTVTLRVDRRRIEDLVDRAPEIGDVLIAFCHSRMLENLVRVSPVLEPVPLARRPDIIARFDTDYFGSGAVIVNEGEEGTSLFLIVSGRVQVLKDEGGEQTLVAHLGPGDVFGEISFLMRRPSTASVVAEENTAVLRLDAGDFHELTSEFPELLKGTYDIARKRDEVMISILARDVAGAEDLVLL